MSEDCFILFIARLRMTYISHIARPTGRGSQETPQIQQFQEQDGK
jgi:hypothetical protein